MKTRDAGLHECFEKEIERRDDGDHAKADQIIFRAERRPSECLFRLGALLFNYGCYEMQLEFCLAPAVTCARAKG